MTMCDFVASRDPLKYVTQFQGSRENTAPLAPWLVKYVDHFSVPYFYSYELGTVNMWLGYAAGDSGTVPSTSKTVTNAHFDGVDNLFAVISGKKTFYLWDPTSARGLYTYAPVTSISDSGRITMGNPPNPDIPKSFSNPYVLKRPKTAQVPIIPPNELEYSLPNGEVLSGSAISSMFPMFKRNTTMAMCEVNPGDMIYFPGCYFHEVVSSGRHLGINFWMRYSDSKDELLQQNPSYGNSGLRISSY